MKTFDLKTFDKDLNDIIVDFGKSGKIFSNEEQFQFELALALEREYQKDASGYPRVRLEVLSPASNKKNALAAMSELADMTVADRTKMYTDIVVDMNDSESIAIELKYKTKGHGKTKYYDYSVGNTKYRVFNHGASPLGCAQYLADIMRLEQLCAGKILFDLCHPQAKRKVVRGYAIIISNDSLYWDTHTPGTDADMFSLTCGSNSKNGYTKKGKTKYPSLQLTGTYRFDWKPYYPQNGTKIANPEFKYLITVI